jgi:urease beta subunit
MILSIGFIAAKYNPYTPVPTDQEVIKFNDVAYDGMRLYIGPVSTNSSRSELKFTISNTGRRDIRLGSGFDDIVINLDPSFNQIGSQSEVKKIVDQMMGKKKLITTGTVLTGQIMDLESAPAAEVSKPAKQPSSKPKASTNKKKPSRPEPEKIDMGNGTTVLETPEKEGDNKRSKFLDPNDCPDLMIKDIEIIKVNKYMIAIEYTVKNQGTGTAELHGSKSAVDDNMFLKAYLSATPKFSRSATTIGETAVRKEMGTKDGTLDRTREFKGKMYMNVRGRTNLTPYLILTLDPYQTVRECNERNNRSYIKIEE